MKVIIDNTMIETDAIAEISRVHNTSQYNNTQGFIITYMHGGTRQISKNGQNAFEEMDSARKQLINVVTEGHYNDIIEITIPNE